MANSDVSTQLILSEQTGRYKRNTLIANLIITVLYFSDAPLGDVKLFGVGLSSVDDSEAIAWLVCAIIAFYQWAMMAYSGWRDWRKWDESIREVFHFSPFVIGTGRLIGARYWVDGYTPGLTIMEVASTESSVRWGAGRAGKPTKAGDIAKSDISHIRWRLIPFLTFEFLGPLLWGAACVVLAAVKAYG